SSAAGGSHLRRSRGQYLIMNKGVNRSLRSSAHVLAMSGSAAFAQTFQSQSQLPNTNRPALEQQFRERVARLAQQRIGLSDAQMTQLEQSNARFAPQLNQVVAQEREAR